MNSAASHTAPTSCRTSDSYQVMSFPVMNQLLCRGSSSNTQRTTHFSLPSSQKSSFASSVFFQTFHEIVTNEPYPHSCLKTQNQNREEQNYV